MKNNRSHLFIAEKVYESILGEKANSEKKVAGSYPDESYKYGWSAFEEEEFDKDGKTTWHEDREWTKQYYKSIGMLK
tara:strand:- start:8576 stop:8806 length:231 start_codon:yes stop_codon:yes gene_type:complete